MVYDLKKETYCLNCWHKIQEDWYITLKERRNNLDTHFHIVSGLPQLSFEGTSVVRQKIA